MAGNIKGITIEIGGNTQPLNKALADVNKKSKDLQSELRQVEKLLKLDPKNTELLAQKQKLLAEAVANSKEKLDRLKTAQQQVNEQFAKGEINEEQYRAFQREVVKAEQELSKFEKQLRETGLTAEQVGKKLQDAGQKMTDMGKNLSMKVTAPIVAAGAASFKMAADLEDAMGATDQIFKGAADSVKSWADNLESYYGIAEGEALEYANMMGTMLVNIGGLTEQEAARQAQVLIELAGDLTAMYGGTTQDAVRALTGALKGNNTMLDNYGMAVNDAMIKTKALEMGLYDGTGQMDLATKQAATLALIMEQTGAAQGQAAREAEGASGGMRAFATEIKNLATDIGEVLLPVITPLLNSLGDIVKKFSELSPETQKTIVTIAGLAAAIGPLLITFGLVAQGMGAVITSTAKFGGVLLKLGGLLTKLPVLFTALTGPIGITIAAVAALIAIGVALYKNWDEIKAFGAKLWEDLKTGWTEGMAALKKGWTEGWAAIGTMFKGWGEQIASAWSTLWDGLKKFLVEWWPLLLGAIAGPMGLVAGAIYKNWDEIKAKTLEVWDSIKAFFEEWWKKLTDWMSTWNPWGAVKNIWNNFKTQIMQVWNNLKETLGTWWDTFTSWLSGWSPWRAVETLWGTFKTNIVNVWNNLKETLGTWWDTFTTWLGTWNPWNTVKEIWGNFKTNIIGVWNGLKETLGTWWDTFTTWLGTWNPWNFVKAKWNEFKANIMQVWNNLKTETNTWWNTFTSWLGTWNPWNFVQQAWNNFKTQIMQVWTNLKTETSTWWATFTTWLGTWNPWSNVQEIWNNFKTNIVGVWTDLNTTLNTWWTTFTSWLGTWNPWSAVEALWDTWKSNTIRVWENLKNDALNFGRDIVQGLADGITEKLSAAKNAISNVANSIKSSVKGILGIASPSVVMHAFGEAVSTGLANGIEAKAGVAIQAATTMASAIQTQAAAAMAAVSAIAQAAADAANISTPADIGKQEEGDWKGAFVHPNYTSALASETAWRKFWADYSEPLRNMGADIKTLQRDLLMAAYEMSVNPALQRAEIYIAPDVPNYQLTQSRLFRGIPRDTVRMVSERLLKAQFTPREMAAGGIVTRPTLSVIGEAGYPEAVLPLPKLQPMMTDALLGAVEALGGGNITNNKQINLQVINRGTIVGRGGMDEFARTVSKQISRDFGLATGGAW